MKILFRNNEPVSYRVPCGFFQDEVWGTIVCTPDYKRDDITEEDTGAIILLYPQYRTTHPNDIGLRFVERRSILKQY